MFEIDNAIIGFDNQTQISLSMSFQPGEICTITGPSGVGKSSLLMAIAGFRTLDKGHLRFAGKAFDNLPVWERPISLLFQSDNIFPHLTVVRNISLGAPKTADKDAIQAQITAICERLGISDILHQSAGQISGGQQQRVGLARSLLSGKPILLLDEPFSALDTENRHNALTLVAEITKEHQLTTIIVTHDDDDITFLKARLVALHRQPI